jgi:hypothetical protein
MTTQIVELIAKISKLELENSNLIKERDILRNEEQIIVSKKNELENKITYKSKEVNEAWQLLKELIVKGNIE